MLIADLKTKSPFGFYSKFSELDLLDLARRKATAVCVPLDSNWGGSTDYLNTVSMLTNATIIARITRPTNREIHNALSIGAEFVLSVGTLPTKSLQPYCFLESTSLEELKQFKSKNHDCVYDVYNPTNSITGKLKEFTFNDHKAYFDKQIIYVGNPKNLSNKTIFGFIVDEQFYTSTNQT